MEMSAIKRKINRDGDVEDADKDAKRLRMELQRPLRLLDLPLGPLHLIFAKLPLESQKLLRNVSKELREEHNDFALHNYKAFTHQLRNFQGSDPNNVKLNILKVVEEASNHFVISGYVSSFINNLPIFFQGKDDVDVGNMQQLLHRFYHQLEWSPSQRPNGAAGRMLLHRRRLMFMVTLLNLLRQFHSYRKISSRMNLMHWQLHIELKGVHITANHERNPNIKEEDKLVDFMTLVAELLVYDMSESTTGFSRYIDIGSSVYNYGLKRQQQVVRGTRLDLKFSILAPLALRNLLEDVLAGNVDKSRAVKCPLLDSFSIQLDLKNSGVNWISNKNWQICMLPLL